MFVPDVINVGCWCGYGGGNGALGDGIMRAQSRFRWVISAVFCGDFSWVPLVFLVGFCWVIYLIVLYLLCVVC